MVDHYQVVRPGLLRDVENTASSPAACSTRVTTRAAPKAVIINETLAHAIWGDASPLGRQHRNGNYRPTRDTRTRSSASIADVKNNGVDKPDGHGDLSAARASCLPDTGLLRAPYHRGALRGRAGIAVAGAMRRRGARRGPELPLAEIRTLDDVVAASQSRPRFITLVLTSFAGVSLVARGHRNLRRDLVFGGAANASEFGIRIALGAQARGVLQPRARRRAAAHLPPACWSALSGSYALTRFLSGFLFGVSAERLRDVRRRGVVLALVAMLASYLPARRATKRRPARGVAGGVALIVAIRYVLSRQRSCSASATCSRRDRVARGEIGDRARDLEHAQR